jgi:predicted transcriptional regulator
MTTQSTDHVMMLGPREAEIMQLLWLHGPSTVRELLRRIDADPPIAYTTVMSICVALMGKGLLIRRKATLQDRVDVSGAPFLYEAAVGEASFTPLAQSIEGRLVMSLPVLPAVPQGAPPTDAAEQHALAQRAEAAERRAVTLAAKLARAERQTLALEHRAQLAEERAVIAERRVEQLERQLARPPRRKRQVPTWFTSIVEHRDPAGICRVCGVSAPLLPHPRSDGLRVCLAETCREEAKRRDNATKQRRYNARIRKGHEPAPADEA